MWRKPLESEPGQASSGRRQGGGPIVWPWRTGETPRRSESQYDRALLLGPKRNEVLSLAEVQQYGRDSYGDPDYLCLYGMKPADWYGSGVRVLGRTAVECTRDALADHIGRDVAVVAGETSLVIDPFTGSGNTLYWLQQHLGAQGVGFELDDAIFATTADDLGIVEQQEVRVSLGAYEDGIQTSTWIATASWSCSWRRPGDALDPVEGLDLARTTRR